MKKKLLIALTSCLSLVGCNAPEIRPFIQCQISLLGTPIVKNGQKHHNVVCSCRGYCIKDGSAGPCDDLEDIGIYKKSRQYKDELCDGMVGVPLREDHGYRWLIRDVKKRSEWVRDQLDRGKR